jgi:hypothetical protein
MIMQFPVIIAGDLGPKRTLEQTTREFHASRLPRFISPIQLKEVKVNEITT